MNLNYLKTFHCLSVNLNFSKTAKLLKTSQPAISRQIKQLEEHYGRALFIRNKKSVVLSEFGEALKARLSSVVIELDELLNLNTTKNTSIMLRGASIQEFGKFYVFPKLVTYLKENSNIHLNLSLGSSSKTIEDLNLGKLDFGITHLMPTHKSIEVVKLKKEKSVLIGSYKSDLKDFNLASEIPFVGYRSDDAYSEKFFEKNFKKNIRQKFKQIYSVNSHQLMCQMVANLSCYAVLPLSSIQDELKSKKIKILMENKDEDHVYFIYHESLTQNIQIIKIIREIIQKLKA